MRLLYLANIRLPTEKAHGAQIMKMCEAMAALGHEVELVVTDRRTPIADDAFAYYDIKSRFTITRLPVWDAVEWGKAGFWLESMSFARAANRLLRARNPDIVYGRDEQVLARIRTRAPLVWETHTGAWSTPAKRVAARARKIVAISQGLKDCYVAHGVPADKIVVAHDGIDLDAFAHPQEQAAARARLGLPAEAKLAMYVGRLDGWKGTGTLFEAAKDFNGVSLAVIGGEVAQVAALKVKYPQVRYLGYRPYRELADNLSAADVLILPNTGKDEVSARFTSPLKLFAYMAAEKPIVASDLPSIREVLGDAEAYFFRPDDAVSLAAAVAAATGPAASERGARARAKASAYTWSARAARVLEAIVS